MMNEVNYGRDGGMGQYGIPLKTYKSGGIDARNEHASRLQPGERIFNRQTIGTPVFADAYVATSQIPSSPSHA